MERIASALGVTLAQFFVAAEGRPPSAIVRADSRPVLNSAWSNATLEALRDPGHDRSRLEPSLITIESGGTSGKHAQAVDNEEFAVVLDGKVNLWLDEAEESLTSGDAVTILAGTRRRWVNPGPSAVRILIVSRRP